jgi:hypothetical protein
MIWVDRNVGPSIAKPGFAYGGIDRTVPGSVHVNCHILEHVHAVEVHAVAD